MEESVGGAGLAVTLVLAVVLCKVEGAPGETGRVTSHCFAAHDLEMKTSVLLGNPSVPVVVTPECDGSVAVSNLVHLQLSLWDFLSEEALWTPGKLEKPNLCA